MMKAALLDSLREHLHLTGMARNFGTGF